MPSYHFKDGFPCFAADASFHIRDCMVYQIRDGQEVAAWDYWNYHQSAPDGFPVAEIQQFWRDLAAAPHSLIAEDQWSSSYYSLLGDCVVHWSDDRQQGASFIHACLSRVAFLQALHIPLAARNFVSAKESP